MNALEIKQKLNKFPSFKGVYSRDNLPKKLIHPFGVIVNWDRKSEPGSHWCAIFVDANRNGHYFDPLGITPIFPELKTFILNNSNQLWSKFKIKGARPAESFVFRSSSRCSEEIHTVPFIIPSVFSDK